MRATPDVTKWGDDAGKLRPSTVIPLHDDGGLIVQCKVWDPPSLAGRTVDVFFPASVVDDMLRAFRDKARDNRQRSGPQNDHRSPLLDDEDDPFESMQRLIADAERMAGD